METIKYCCLSDQCKTPLCLIPGWNLNTSLWRMECSFSISDCLSPTEEAKSKVPVHNFAFTLPLCSACICFRWKYVLQSSSWIGNFAYATHHTSPFQDALKISYGSNRVLRQQKQIGSHLATHPGVRAKSKGIVLLLSLRALLPLFCALPSCFTHIAL